MPCSSVRGWETVRKVGTIPYKSAKQRAYLHAKKPKLAAKWDRKYGGKVKPTDKKK